MTGPTAVTDTIIALEGVLRVYNVGPAVPCPRSWAVNLRINRGEFVAITDTRAGKSTK